MFDNFWGAVIILNLKVTETRLLKFEHAKKTYVR